MQKLENIGVLGAGAWGTALASVVARKYPAREIPLWAHEAATAAAINDTHINKTFLPDISLPENIRASDDMACLKDAEAILMVAPSQFARSILGQAVKVAPDAIYVLCSKGLEQGSLQFMSEVAEAHLPPTQLAVLSGPSFADEVARGLPAAATLACADEDKSRALSEAIGSDGFRLYLSSDVIGAEVGGVIKNVLAIACGIVSGKEMGENARAALITRGFIEMQLLGQALGARRETLTGLCGLGDLLLTCVSTRSRNSSLGEALGRGQTAKDYLGTKQSVSEGAASAKAVRELAAKHKLEMPICAAVAAIVEDGLDVDKAIAEVLARPISYELEIDNK